MMNAEKNATQDDGRLFQFQVEAELKATGEVSTNDLEDLAERILGGLHHEAKMIAFGPAVSVNLATSAVEVEYTAQAYSASDLYTKAARVYEILERVSSASAPAPKDHCVLFEFEGGTTQRSELVSA